MFPDEDKNERFLTFKENLKIWSIIIGINVLIWGSLFFAPEIFSMFSE